MYTVLLLIVLLFCIIIVGQKLFRNNELFTDMNIRNYSNFESHINTFSGKKKYVLIFTGGPTLKEFKKDNLPDYIWDNSYVIAVKNAVNHLHDIDVKPDFLVTNFIGAAERIDFEKIPDSSINIGLNYGSLPKLKQKMHYTVNLVNSSNAMKMVKEDVKGIEFKNIDNVLYSNWGHVMMELAIPLSIYLNPKTLITIGWDVKNQKSHWDSRKETFTNWHEEDTILNDFSCYLHKYMKKHYNIKIYKINKNSAIKLPYFRINNI